MIYEADWDQVFSGSSQHLPGQDSPRARSTIQQDQTICRALYGMSHQKVNKLKRSNHGAAMLTWIRLSDFTHTEIVIELRRTVSAKGDVLRAGAARSSRRDKPRAMRMEVTKSTKLLDVKVRVGGTPFHFLRFKRRRLLIQSSAGVQRVGDLTEFPRPLPQRSRTRQE